jgi:hypothetical protein
MSVIPTVLRHLLRQSLRTSRRAGFQPSVPRVEAMEGRRLLTLVLGFDGGRLDSIVARNGAQTADVTLTVQAGNKLKVTEGTAVRGTFTVAKKLSITLGDNDGGFLNRLDLNNRTLTADVSVRLGDTNGLNQFHLTTPSGGAGTLKGNFSFRGGDTGGEFVIFGERGDQTAVRTINVTGSVDVDMGGGGDDPNSSDANAGPPDAVATGGNGPTNSVLNVGGNMTVANSTVLALRGKIGGNLVSDSSAKPVGQLVILGNFSHPFTVGRNLTVKTGSAADDVEFQAITVKGNARIQTGYGNDKVLVTSDVDLTGTVPTRLGGVATIDLGDGDDTLDVVNAEVRGTELTLLGGAGNDTVTVTALKAPAATAFVALGAGDDAARAAAGAKVSVARLVLDGGAGTDAVDFGGNTFAFPVKVQDVP